MKWFVILLILLILAGAVWLRTVRQAAGVTHRPHRLDDDLTNPPSPDLHSGAEPPSEPPRTGSGFGWKPGITDEADATDPPPADGRTTA